MTFNPSVPLNSASPAIFPGQNQVNMSRLQILLGGDHQFNLSASADDGYHNLIHMVPQAPSGALPGIGRGYGKSSSSRIHDFYMDDTGVEYQITPTLPIRASVNFDGTGSTGAQTIRSQFNVASVVKVSTGLYTVNFTSAMPDNNYMVQITGMRNGTVSVSNGCVSGNSSYSSSVQTGLLKVQFFGQDNTPRDVFMGNITIFSVN